MGLVALFFIATGVSFLGSLQLGPVNSEVLRFSIRGRKKEALLVGIGGSLPEIPYALAAAYLIQHLLLLPGLRSIFAWLFIVVIVGLGIKLIFKRPKDMMVETYQVKRSPFLIGFILASLNPQLIFFWSGILVWLGYETLSMSEGLVFALGATCGALLLQLLAMKIGSRLFRSGYIKNLGNVDRTIGLILVLIGLWVAIKELFL